MCSKIALKLYGMIKQRIIKSNAQFWHDFFDKEIIDGFEIDLERLEKELYENGCVGSISELYDSCPPRLPKGAIAQAWSVAEVFRIIEGRKNN